MRHHLYIYEFVILFCLLVCPIKTQDTWTDLPQILIGVLGKPTELFLALLRLK